MQRFRKEGMPGRPQSAGKRLPVIAFGMEWDAAAKESRDNLPYRGSREEMRHQLGMELPSEENRINDSRRH